MRIINKKIATDYQSAHPDSKASLRSLLSEMEAATWSSPNELAARYPKASRVNGKVIFDIAGNKYRLQATIYYERQTILLDRIGMHKEYDKWNI